MPRPPLWLSFISPVLLVLPVSASGALIDRGNGLIFDSVLGITWLQDANLAATETFGISGITSDGSMSLATANEWIAAMNAASYLGYSNWRLTAARPVNGSEFIINPPSNNGATDTGFGSSGTSSEIRYMYYTNLGNLGQWIPNGNGSSTSQEQQIGFGLVNAGPFLNLGAFPYHVVATGAAIDTGQGYDALIFNFFNGLQDAVFSANSSPQHAWAVRDGDVVPIPSALWLFVTGGIALGACKRRRRNS